MQKTDSRTRSLPIKIRLTSDNKKDSQVITGMVYESLKNMMIIY